MKYTQSEISLIAADSLRELTYKQKKLLLASVNPANADRQKYAEALIKIEGSGVYNKIKEKISDKNYLSRLLSSYEKRGISCVTIKSEKYPERLKHINAPPLVLYTRGNVKLLSDRLFAVVGSRRTTQAVLEQCRRVTERLSEKLTVVTGIADGGDSAAVNGAIESGRIICVLPGGHDSDCSPNRTLLRSVEERGLTISEYPPETPVQKHTYIMRNRIIAALGEGVLVVSAGEKSGALSTASFAADYSRDVFAFPYGIGVSSGKGCNRLIKEGAYLAECAEDIFSILGIEYEGEAAAQEELSGDEEKVVAALKDGDELHAERLATVTGMKLTDLLTVCSLLEIKGIIVRNASNTFTLLPK